MHFIIGGGAGESASIDEKRKAAQFPSKVSDTYVRDIEQWYGANAPLRINLIDAKLQISNKMDKYYRDSIQPQLAKVLVPSWYENTDSETKVTGKIEESNIVGVPGQDDTTTAESIAGQAGAASGRGENGSADSGGTAKDGAETGTPAAAEQEKLKPLPPFVPDPDIDIEGYVPPVEENGALYGRGDWLFYTGEYSIDYYRGTNALSEEEMAQWKADIEELNSICEAKGIRLAVVLAPNKEQVYPEYMPTYQVEGEAVRANAFAAYMEGSEAHYRYLLNELKAARGLGELYLRQDTHWNSLGAYVALQAIYEELQLPFIPVQKLEIRESAVSGGDITNFCGFKSEYVRYDVDYKPEVNVTASEYESGYIMKYRAENAQNQCKAVVIGDSFAGELRQLVAKDFSQTTAMHRDSIDNQVAIEAIEQLGEGDVLIIIAVERYDRENIECIRKLAGLL